MNHFLIATFVFFSIGSYAADSEASRDASCPQKSIHLLLNCNNSKSPTQVPQELQFLNHAGTYELVSDEIKPASSTDQKVVSCQYVAKKWFSTYRLDGENIQVTNLEQIVNDVAKKLLSFANAHLKAETRIAENPTIDMQYLVQDGEKASATSEQMFFINLGFETVYDGTKHYFAVAPQQLPENEVLNNNNSKLDMQMSDVGSANGDVHISSLMDSSMAYAGKVAPSNINTRLANASDYDEDVAASNYLTGSNCQISFE